MGINMRAYTEQIIKHAHMNLIPRYIDDVTEPKGGLRNLKEAI